MQLETRDLASFAVLAEHLHFGRAAARLHVSQPALSKRIKSLEEKIGGPLLVRNRRGVTLTPAGAMFYKECPQNHPRHRHCVRSGARRHQRRTGEAAARRGHVHRAQSGSPRPAQVPRKPVPESKSRSRTCPRSDQIEALIAGRLDVGFVRLPVNHPQLAMRKVLTERLTIATSEKFAGPLTMKGIQEQAFHSHRSRRFRHLSRSLHQPVRPLRIHSENRL